MERLAERRVRDGERERNHDEDAGDDPGHPRERHEHRQHAALPVLVAPREVAPDRLRREGASDRDRIGNERRDGGEEGAGDGGWGEMGEMGEGTWPRKGGRKERWRGRWDGTYRSDRGADEVEDEEDEEADDLGDKARRAAVVVAPVDDMDSERGALALVWLRKEKNEGDARPSRPDQGNDGRCEQLGDDGVVEGEPIV